MARELMIPILFEVAREFSSDRIPFVNFMIDLMFIRAVVLDTFNSKQERVIDNMFHLLNTEWRFA